MSSIKYLSLPMVSDSHQSLVFQPELELNLLLSTQEPYVYFYLIVFAFSHDFALAAWQPFVALHHPNILIDHLFSVLQQLMVLQYFLLCSCQEVNKITNNELN
jgi:hypothetical protein